MAKNPVGADRAPSNVVHLSLSRPGQCDQPSFKQSAEMMIATAVFKVLTAEQKANVRGSISTLAYFGLAVHAEPALQILERIK